MLDSRLDDPIRERLATANFDWRQGWAGPHPESGEILAWPESAATAAATALLAPIAILTIESSLEPLRAQPSHRGEMVSELRGGEWLTGLLHEGDWWLVAGEDGYVGWVHGWVVSEQSVAERSALSARRVGAYAHPLGTLWISDHTAASPLSLGTPLLAVEGSAPDRPGWVLAATPAGAEGWLPASEVRAGRPEGRVAEVLQAARALLGTPYRWGGRGPLGFDCSGFVQTVWLLAGHALPRDASQQQHVGERVDATDRETWSSGDLLLFGDPADHVGIYDGRDGMIHCSGVVRREKLSELTQRLERLSAVRRVTSAEAVSEPTLWSLPPASGDSG